MKERYNTMLFEEGLRLIESVFIAIGPWPSLLLLALLIMVMIKKPKTEKE